MSYDCYFVTKIDGNDVTLEECGNYTSNVSSMWRKALASATGNPETWDKWCDRACYESVEPLFGRDMVDVLDRATSWMRTHPEEFTSLDPGNGWGDFDGALRYLETIFEAAKKWPSGMFQVSR